MKKMTGMKPLLLTFCAVGVLSAMNQTWAADVVTNCAQVSKANEQDVNSTPGSSDVLSAFNNDPATLQNDESCAPVTIEATPTYSIGNRVWIDTDNSGDATTGEVGAGAGVKLILKDDGAEVKQTVTDEKGRYLFSGLAAGDNYQVCVSAENFAAGGKLEGYLPSTGPNQKLDPSDEDVDGLDSGDDTGVGDICADALVLNDNEPLGELGFTDLRDGDDGQSTPDNRSNLTVDFGVVPPKPPAVSVGNYIWEDTDKDGIQDAAEKGITGVTVTLTDKNGDPVKDLNDVIVAAKPTDANGYYQFDNLPAGEYQLIVSKPTDYDFTKPLEGTDTTADSNCAVADGKIAPFTLGVGEEIDDGDDNANNDPTQDCGLVKQVAPPPAVSVGNYIWEDTDKDGIQDAAEKGIAGVIVTLTDKNGNPVKDLNDVTVVAQPTDVDGFYQFDNLPAGEYQLIVSKPTDYDFTKPLEGTDTTADSNCAVADGKIAPFTLGVGEEIDDGDDNANNDPTQDCGLVKQVAPPTAVSVGNYIWEDTDKDGIQDAAEKGIAGVTVTLTDKNGNPVKDLNDVTVVAQPTDVDGFYQFDNLPAGEYQIVVSKPTDYDFTKPLEGTDTTADSNCAVADGKIAPFTLGVGEEIDDGDDNANNDPTQDCGLVKQVAPPTAVSVGNYIWEDTDKDGIQDAAEKGIAGVTVTLTDKNGDPVKDLNDVIVAAKPTDANGYYQFDNLPAGEYQLIVSKPTDYDFTKPLEGTDTTADSNCAVADGKIAPFTLGVGEEIDDGDDNANNDPTQDCGLYKPAAPTPTYSIGNRVWIDTNNSGDANTDEVGVALGIKLILKDDGGTIVDETETDASGRYLFSGLDAGSYQVCLLAENFAVGGKLAGYLSSTGANEKDNPDIGGDDNRGIDGDDNGSNNASVDICANLTELNDQEPLKELGFTENNDGDDGKSTPDNRSNLSIDFGVVPPPKKTVNIGDYIWIDTDKDGLQDPEELPLKGAEVTLLNKDGSPVVIDGDMAVPSQTTDEDGKYLFTGLPEGEYIIKVQAEGYTLTKSGGDVDANASNTDSNCEADLGGTAPFSLMAGQEPEVDGDGANGNLTIDCGMYPTPTPVVKHSLGNKVWIDDGNGTAANANNGQMDAGEKPVVDGVRMELWNTAEPPQNMRSITTVNGFYVFDDLEAGDYRVCIASGNFAATGLLANYTASTGGNELDPNEDVDKNDNGDDDLQYGICNTKVITLGAGEPTAEADTASGNPGDDGKGTADNRSNLTLDFGVLPPPAAPETVGVGDKMWVDLDGNGKQDPGDPGLGGVTVKLLDKDGKLVATQVTKPDGSYFFDKLTEGDYRIVAIPPSLYNIVTKNAGGVDDKPFNDDSNCAADGSTALFTLNAGAEPTDDGDTDANTNRSVDCGFVPHVQIPTVSEWGLAIMSMLLATVTFFRRRRED